MHDPKCFQNLTNSLWIILYESLEFRSHSSIWFFGITTSANAQLFIFFTPVNLNLKRLKAIDQDNGDYGKVTYSIIQSVRSDTKELFEVEPDSGWVKLKKPLDREKAAEHVLFIRAQDGAQPEPLSGKSM